MWALSCVHLQCASLSSSVGPITVLRLILHACVPCCGRSFGKEPAWVDLEAEPKVDKDNPPDLKLYADAAVPLAASDDSAAPAGPAAGAAAAAPAKLAAPPAAAGSKKADKKAGGAAKKGDAAATPQPRADDVLRITDELLSKVGWAH